MAKEKQRNLPVPVSVRVIDDKGNLSQPYVRYLSDLHKYVAALEKRLQTLEALHP